MSWTDATEPAARACDSTPVIETIIESRVRSIDGFSVGRVLPSAARRMVGPFIFFDQMGPEELTTGRALDVRPHPHINLATVTYLLAGEILHRDSLGSEQPIRPGAINWMTAGHGIVHSERTPVEQRKTGGRLYGLQLWVALPQKHEEMAPEFHHHPADTLPDLDADGVRLRILAGRAYGATSPVRALSPMFYVEASLPASRRLPLTTDYAQRAAYVIEGAVTCGAERAERGRMLVFAEGTAPVLRAEVDTRLVLIGGEALDGPRHVWWNFVSSSKDRIRQAEDDWRARRFPVVPGDEVEFVPIPPGSSIR